MRSPEEVSAALHSMNELKRICTVTGNLDLLDDVGRAYSILLWVHDEHAKTSFGDMLAALAHLQMLEQTVQ